MYFLRLALFPLCSIVALLIFFTPLSEILHVLSTQLSPNFYRSFSSCPCPWKLSLKQKNRERGYSAVTWKYSTDVYTHYTRLYAHVLSTSSHFFRESVLSWCLFSGWRACSVGKLDEFSLIIEWRSWSLISGLQCCNAPKQGTPCPEKLGWLHHHTVPVPAVEPPEVGSPGFHTGIDIKCWGFIKVPEKPCHLPWLMSQKKEM